MADRPAGQPRLAGWKRDPSGRHFGRYWDGDSWTEHVISAEKVQSVDPLPPRPEPSLFPDSDPPPAPIPKQEPAAGSMLTGPTTSGPEPTAPEWTSQASGSPSKDGGPWAKVRSWPRWAHWTAGISAIVLIIAAASSGDDDKETVKAGQGSASTTRATMSHVQVTPAPTAAPATAPLTTARTMPRDAQLQAMTTAFEKIRTGLADAVKNDNRSDISSVDRLELDPAGPTIILSTTSHYSTDKLVRDGAWAVTKTMQIFWEAKNLGSLPDVIPKFRLSVSHVRYECPHDFMVRLASLRASREDWEATCRV